ncbi:MAG: hypothetical protein GC162_12340 [Planctomycetes bacterium]|nr:hypothetical protein [Planctomycetota bacterium]
MYGAKSAIDNPAGGADVASGIAFRNTTASSGVEFAFMKITLAANLPSGIRLGVLTNNSGGTDIPLSIRLAQTTGTGTDSVMYSVPNENQPDWYFFDITGGVGGDVFTLFTTSRGGKPTIGGLTVDLIPTPAALPAGLTLLGLTSMRRRR